MPVISYASSKGGCGKTTSALLLACELAEQYEVVLIDTDDRGPIHLDWAKLPGKPDRLTVIRSTGEDYIQDEIDDASMRVPFVLVDLPGETSRMVTVSMQMSDLILIPSQESRQDAKAALHCMKAVQQASRAARREIEAAVLITRRKQVGRDRYMREINEELRRLTRVLDVEIKDRAAFGGIQSTGGGIRNTPSGTYGRAGLIQNIEQYRDEVLDILRQQQGAAA